MVKTIWEITIINVTKKSDITNQSKPKEIKKKTLHVLAG